MNIGKEFKKVGIDNENALRVFDLVHMDEMIGFLESVGKDPSIYTQDELLDLYALIEEEKDDMLYNLADSILYKWKGESVC